MSDAGFLAQLLRPQPPVLPEGKGRTWKPGIRYSQPGLRDVWALCHPCRLKRTRHMVHTRIRRVSHTFHISAIGCISFVCNLLRIWLVFINFLKNCAIACIHLIFIYGPRFSRDCYESGKDFQHSNSRSGSRKDTNCWRSSSGRLATPGRETQCSL